MTTDPMGQVRVSLADLRAAPDDSSERVNQALLGTPLTVLEEPNDPTAGDWLHVCLPDYKGWMHGAAIQRPALPEPAGPAVRIAAMRTNLHILAPGGRPGDETVTAYAGTYLPMVTDAAPVGSARVRLPDGREALVDSAALAPRDPAYRGSVAAVIETACAFLGTPYLWGGMTVEGIDCSGLMQICYRVQGWTLPRDADEQFHEVVQAVAPDRWRPGDLIFYGHGPERVIHVMLYIGDEHVIHAKGSAQVIIQSMNPAHPDYHARTDQYLGARRVIPARPDEE